MTSKLKYEVRFTNQFKKDLKLAKKQGKDLEKMYRIVEVLANGERLSLKYRDHALTGNLKGLRECHIEPDWLLVYEFIDAVLVLMLNRLGSHSDLFQN
jgi:mRNA interferase YafQ